MHRSDRDLGMDRPISRRDFLNGASALALSAAACPISSAHASETGASPYPPSRTGYRGSHAGSFETMHQVAWEGRTDFGPEEEEDTSLYDLVVVGSGISGLAAAHFYLQEKPNARVLILENHDDFGGHAKRNEFNINGKMVLGHGGSQTIDTPSGYSDESAQLLRDLAIDLDVFDTAYDHDFYKRHDLTGAFHFNAADYGEDKLVKLDLFGGDGGYIPLANSDVGSMADAFPQMPIATEAREQLAFLTTATTDQLPDHSIFSEPSYLSSITYKTFLERHMGVTHPQAHQVLQDLMTPLYAYGIDAIPALEALFVFPGLQATSLGSLSWLMPAVKLWGTEPYICHFPDGNASVTRMLVRKLIPEVADGSTMHDIVTAQFDYSQLDRPQNQVRLRLNSTVINVEHDGAPETAEQVLVKYVSGGKAHRVTGKRVIFACYNMAIPHLCPTLPNIQRENMAELVKAPLVYSNVAFTNWRAWKKAGVGLVESPNRWHTLAMLDFPVSLGDYQYSQSPDEPIVAHMVHVPTEPGLSPKNQHRAGRYELLNTSFEDYERELRDHLTGMLGHAGFDPVTDIAGITVNRWSHGYTWQANSVFDPDDAEGEGPHEIGRKRFSRISIANSDAGARAYFDEGIDQGYRAAMEQAAG